MRYCLWCVMLSLALAKATVAWADPLPEGPGVARAEAKFVHFQFDPRTPKELQAVVAKLHGRTFDKIVPSLDADPRRLVRLRFGQTLEVYAQFAAGGRAEQEWRANADKVIVTPLGKAMGCRLTLDKPRVKVDLGKPIELDRLEVDITWTKAGRPEFRFPQDATLPAPFPMCEKFTVFRELVRVD